MSDRCAERRDAILFRTARLLDGDDERRLDTHLRTGCPRCAGALAEARAVIEALQDGIPAVAAPPSVKRALMARIEADATARGTNEARDAGTSVRDTRPRRSARARAWAPYAAAALAAGVTFVAVAIPMRMRLDVALESQAARFEAELVSNREALARMQARLDDASGVASLLQARSLRLIPMQPSEPQRGAWGRIAWDESSGVWQLYTFDMAPAGPDRTYELWFITPDERKIPAGTFDIDENGIGSLRVDVPRDLGEIALAAITDEPAGGAPQPTGSIQLVGSIDG